MVYGAPQAQPMIKILCMACANQQQIERLIALMLQNPRGSTSLRMLKQKEMKGKTQREWGIATVAHSHGDATAEVYLG